MIKSFGFWCHAKSWELIYSYLLLQENLEDELNKFSMLY